MTACPNCGFELTSPTEPPLGAWVRDQHGGVSQRRIDADGNDGWGVPGYHSGEVWEKYWAAHGPLIECGPWGAPLRATASPPDRHEES
jgi:hypothetical protein